MLARSEKGGLFVIFANLDFTCKVNSGKSTKGPFASPSERVKVYVK